MDIQPSKTVVIDKPNATLDSIAAQYGNKPASETTEPTETSDPTDEPEPADASGEGGEGSEGGQQGPIRTIPDPTDEPAGDDPVDPIDADDDSGDEGVDLNDIVVEMDGQERSVEELLDERDMLAERVAEIESDPFLKGLIDHYKTFGNIDAYYEAKGVDWDKKDDLEVVKAQFDRENADLNPSVREKLWKREIANKYGIREDLTPEDLESEDYQIAQGLLQRDARKLREQFKEEQSKYQPPTRESQEPAEEPVQYDPEAYRQQLLQDREIRSFMDNKVLPLGVKDGQGRTLGIEPKNPDQIIEMMTDDRKFWGMFIDPATKSINRGKLAKVFAYAQDPDFVEQSLVNLGRNLQLEERIAETSQVDPRLNRGGQSQTPKQSFSKGFLSAALAQKKGK